MKNAMRWAIRLALFLTALVAFGNGVAGADETTADVAAPVGVCGVTIGVLGDTATDCGTPAATAAPAATPPSAPAQAPEADSPSSDPLVGDVDADVQAPVDVCGLDVSVLGDSSTECGSAGAASEPPPADPAAPAPADPAAAPSSDPLVGDLGADAQTPVAVCGIGISVLGDATSDCDGAAGSTAAPAMAASTDVGAVPTILGPVDAAVQAPVGLCGVGVGIGGDTSSDCGARTAPSAVADDPTVPTVPTVPTLPIVPAVPADTGDLPVPNALGTPIGTIVDGIGSGGSGIGAMGESAITSTSRALAEQLLRGVLGSAGPRSLVGALLPDTGGSAELLGQLVLFLLGGGAGLRQLAKALHSS